tara:strand:- start:32 stop:247 length:216 start_codon:yes stop_codon:yes gene_type:complete
MNVGDLVETRRLRIGIPIGSIGYIDKRFGSAGMGEVLYSVTLLNSQRRIKVMGRDLKLKKSIKYKLTGMED